MALVLDASIALSWAFADEEHPTAQIALERLRHEDALVPSVWWFEIRNALIVSERRRRITDGDTAAFLRTMSVLPIQIEPLPDAAAVLTLARRYRLPVYDAAYLELAQRHGLPLASLDRALILAAQAETVPLIGAEP